MKLVPSRGFQESSLVRPVGKSLEPLSHLSLQPFSLPCKILFKQKPQTTVKCLKILSSMQTNKLVPYSFIDVDRGHRTSLMRITEC